MYRTGGVAILASAVLLAALTALAVAFYRPRLPDPQLADRDALLRWLVLRDLASESASTREVLARRIEEEFCEGVDWEATCRELDSAQRERVWENALVLFESWVLYNAARYQAIEQSQRTAFLDGLLDRLSVWRGIECLRPAAPQTQPDNSEASLLNTLLVRVERLKAGCEPELASHIDQFVGALSWRMLVRSLRAPEKKGPSGV